VFISMVYWMAEDSGDRQLWLLQAVEVALDEQGCTVVWFLSKVKYMATTGG
jgi:hypothetical protein